MGCYVLYLSYCNPLSLLRMQSVLLNDIINKDYPQNQIQYFAYFGSSSPPKQHGSPIRPGLRVLTLPYLTPRNNPLCSSHLRDISFSFINKCPDGNVIFILMNEFIRQTRTVLARNFLLNWRTKEFLRELVTVVIFIAVIGVIFKVGENSDSVIPFYMTLAITSYSRAMVISWVSERQTRQKQIQQIMGLNTYAHFIGWLIYFLVNGVYVSVVFMFPLKFLGLFDNSMGFIPFGNMFGLYMLYMLSSFFFVLFLSTFFKDAKIAAQATTFVQLFSSLLYFLIYVQDFCKSSALLRLASIFPPLAFDFAIMSTDIIQKIYPLAFTFNDGLVSLGITSVIYFVLFIYCEQVVPHEFGIPKHPLFFIKWIWAKPASHRESIELLDVHQKTNTPSAKYFEDMNIKTDKTLEVYNLSKSFGALKAVNQLTFSLYERQIFCLLGHNGAGKSTAINLLTGLTQKDQGKIIINGIDLDKNLSAIRKCIGLCLQQNVLYDDLTIEDHFRYYCRIKGVPQHRIQEQVRETVMKCALGNEAGKLSKNLSGGNKRKLCLGNALVGGSKIVFLDEPSSGLDPNSRQSIWEILKEVKAENRTIVLTTHHLQEAEELAQRIAIMTHGKLLILGSCDFIKNKFGVGYHLLITITPEQKDQVMKAVEDNLPGARIDSQSAVNVLKYVLPLNRQKQFTKLFKSLEPLNLPLSLKMCTLEDTFVNIGMNDIDDFEERGDFPDLPQVQQPLGVYPAYRFSSQFKSVFNKKALTVLKSFSSVTSLILPVIFMLVGTLVTILAFKDQPSDVTDAMWNYIKLSVLSYFMVLAFIFNTSSYCGSIVLEREKKFKYLSNVMGLRKLPYWAANFAFDILLFLVPVALFFIITLAFGKQAAFLTDKLPYLIPAFAAFGVAFMTYSYAWSFAFQKSNTAYRFFPFLNFLFFFMLPMIVVFAQRNSDIVKYVIPFTSPFISLYFVFFTTQMGNTEILHVASIWYQIGVMCIQAIVFTLLTVFLENIRFSLKDRYQVDESDIMASGVQDEDVKAEEEKVRNLAGTAPIVCDRLYKKYNNGYVAIRNNTFMLEEGEMFGLLGPNGAGKSTTFNIMTAAIPKTAGSIKLQGTEINKGIMDVFQNVGICPQFDSIYDNLTVTEHLRYFAELKGNSNEALDRLVNYYLKIMQLDDYAKVPAGKLSGGNKRKLSVSMAMIGNPKLMFFDEPSSAVDPIARRFLWKTLNESLKYTGSSIVLTTHSMNEAESLCSRIGILIKGKFVCMGTPASLKKKFGEGHSIVVKLYSWDKLDMVREEVRGLYPTFKEYLDQQSLKATFQIPAETFSFSRTFQLFQNKLVADQHIESFQATQASLEQIFLFFSKMQPVEQDGVARAEPWDFCCFQCGTEGCFLTV